MEPVTAPQSTFQFYTGKESTVKPSLRAESLPWTFPWSRRAGILCDSLLPANSALSRYPTTAQHTNHIRLCRPPLERTQAVVTKHGAVFLVALHCNFLQLPSECASRSESSGVLPGHVSTQAQKEAQRTHSMVFSFVQLLLDSDCYPLTLSAPEPTCIIFV